MSPIDYRRIRELYEAAVELDPCRRSSFLEQACGGDPQLRSEVEQLLHAALNATGFLSGAKIPNGFFPCGGDARSHNFSPGDVLGDRFEVRQHIATGGMGEVYRARDHNLDRDVALKVLPPHLSARPDLVERLKREAKAISSLNHPNICSLYDFCWHGDIGYLVMEYLEGTTLRDRIAAGPCATPEIIDFAIHITEGLVAAHARGMIHRDIKPANLFITSRGQIKIMDFGLAKPVHEPVDVQAHTDGTTRLQLQGGDESLTIPGTITGTMAYMSPEQACGETLDARTDLFSLGAVLYEMSTGQRPFPGDSLPDVRGAILHREPVPVSDLRAGLAPELNRIISKLLQKDRSLRYGTAAELLADLEQVKRRESGREVRRMRWVAVTSGVLASGLVAAFAWYQWLRPARPLVRDIVPVRLTTNPPDMPIGSVELSPDANQLAYSDARGVTVGPLHREERRLLPGTSGLDLVAWSDDGQSLLLAHNSDQLLSIPAAGGPLQLMGARSPKNYELSIKGSTGSVSTRDGRTLCSINEPEGYSIRDEAFSKDRFLLSTIWAAGMGPARVEIHRLSDCSRLVPDSGQTAPLTPPAISPISWNKVRSIYWTSETRFLAAETQLSPVPDSTIWSVELDPRKLEIVSVEQIARLPGMSIANVRAIRDGSTIVFLRFDVKFNVYISEVEKSGRSISAPRRFSNDDRNDQVGEWAPDNSSLFVMSDRNGSLQIFRRPIDGTVGDLLPVVGKPSHVRVSSDGRWILYASAAGNDYRASETRLMRMPIAGGPSEEIFPVGRNLLTHNCARNGTGPCIVTERGGRDTSVASGGTALPEYVLLSVYDPVTGRRREVARIQNAGLTAAISPDGKVIATLMGDSKSIRLYSPQGRLEREVAVQGVKALTSLSWAADSRSWYCGDESASGRVRLLRVELDGTTRLLWDKSGLWAKPSPDGKRLAIFAMFNTSDVWAIHVR